MESVRVPSFATAAPLRSVTVAVVAACDRASGSGAALDEVGVVTVPSSGYVAAVGSSAGGGDDEDAGAAGEGDGDDCARADDVERRTPAATTESVNSGDRRVVFIGAFESSGADYTCIPHATT